MKNKRYIGVMSGTSMDSVDVVSCRVDTSACTLEHSYTYPFPDRLKASILHAIAHPLSLRETGALDHRIGLLFAEAVTGFMQQYGMRAEDVVAIGLHGQTLWHEPEGDTPFSMQMGDPNLVAARTDIPVVADFRRKDMALGGSGAPLAPAFHRFLLQDIENAAVVNIGGIANITVLKADETLGYDTGPGNMLMDAWIAMHKQLPYDKDGNWAGEGKVDYTLLDAMMQESYFSQTPPKSTGRERFNTQWLQTQLNAQRATLNAVNVQRTLLELAAQSIANEVLHFNLDILLLCGGGAYNTLLVERIAALLPSVQTGVMKYAESIEAMMMAWLAYKRMHTEPVELKTVTGARANTILGGVYR
jgi:anhydro-N-acetylmuramic acid kinase